MAAAMGVDCQIIDFGQQSDIDMARVAEALAADREHRIKAVMAVQVDTSTSVKNDIADLRRALDAIDHPALLFADCIACLACDEFHMDDWGVDVMVTGSQKGLMTPPGMGFVFFNDKADGARSHANLVTPYWDWRPRMAPEEFYRYFNGTAPTHHLYGLRVALDMILTEEGLENVWHRHAVLARRLGRAGGLGTGRARSPQHRRAGEAQPFRDHGEFRPRQRPAHARLDDGERGRDAGHSRWAVWRGRAAMPRTTCASAIWATSTRIW
jgi:alanine-glyoxylate transaminase/serine-glyoxylate transaminase/serine-pyruvate transaminase